MSKTKVDQSGFQLSETEIDKEVPFMARGLANAFISWLNAADLNHDGKADIEEIEPILVEALPKIQALSKYIDWSQFSAWLLKQDFFIHNAESAAVLADIETVAQKALSVATTTTAATK